MAKIKSPSGENEHELVPPLCALCHLNLFLKAPPVDTSGTLSAIVGSLDNHEANAVREFLDAGSRCLSRLAGATLHRIKQYTSGLTPASNPEQDQVHALLNQFDSDEDGRLTAKEFKTAVTQITSLSLSEDELDQIALNVDVNGDGMVDIHEFTVWLYGEKSNKTSKRGSIAPTKDIEVRLEEALSELEAKRRELQRIENRHEEEVEASLDFWRSMAKHAVLTIDQKVDLNHSQWLGNGKYGFVLKAARISDNREVVVKMMGLRWAHLAVKEWHSASIVAKHKNVVEYEDVMLHNDDDHTLQKLMEVGYKEGKLHSKKKRTNYPDRYICLTQEFMNRGTVQDWLDEGALTRPGILVVMKEVAAGLAYMHKHHVTHNDIKPENVMLHEEEHRDGSHTIIVKLGDLGLAKKSRDRAADFSQYGMTVFCMATGERFGTRKYREEAIDEIVQECSKVCDGLVDNIQNSGDGGRLPAALSALPGILHNVFHHKVEMGDVVEREELQNWNFGVDASSDGTASAQLREKESRRKRMRYASVRRVVKHTMASSDELSFTLPPM